MKKLLLLFGIGIGMAFLSTQPAKALDVHDVGDGLKAIPSKVLDVGEGGIDMVSGMIGCVRHFVKDHILKLPIGKKHLDLNPVVSPVEKCVDSAGNLGKKIQKSVRKLTRL